MIVHTYGELAAQRLTGRTRGRVGWFGRIVMQVEVRSPKPRYPMAPQPPWEEYDPWIMGEYTFWRDARQGDLYSLRCGSDIDLTAEQVAAA